MSLWTHRNAICYLLVQRITNDYFHKYENLRYKYARRILTGLIFCCIGDAFLMWPNYFEAGMVCFAIGHVHYILAFGFKPLNLPLCTVLFALSATCIVYFLPGLNDILVVGVPLYTLILMTMVWRAIARVQFFEDLWTWSKLCSCAGGILFAVSDFIIGLDRFMSNVEHAQLLIMSTYYAAQLGIALSVVDAKFTKPKDCSSISKEIKTG